MGKTTTNNPKVLDELGKHTKKEKLKKIKKLSTRSPTGKLIYKEAALCDYLEKEGYHLLDNFGAQITGQLIDNVAHIKTPQDVFNDVLALIKIQDNDELRTSWMKQGEDMLIKRKAILGSLTKLKLDRHRDTKDNARLFYQNTIVVIAKKDYRLETYEQFRKSGKYIFSQQIIPRNYIRSVGKKSDFGKFSRLITNDEKHLLSYRTTLGYLISNYKNPSLAKAVIVSDMLSQIENEAYGRSGKGIIIKALSYLINIVEYNGKATDLKYDRFVYQNVTVLTALMVLQDVAKGFVFESLFSTLTDSMSIERKHQSKTSIPFSQSPKIALTTNYTIPQDTDSFKDRKHLIMLNNFFNAKNKPVQHFKKLLFDWNEKEWNRFDNYMVECVRLFLKNGLIGYTNKNVERLKLISQTSEEFVELMESEYCFVSSFFSIKKIAAGMDVPTDEPSSKSRIVGGWIDLYAAYKGYNIERRKLGGVIKICFRP
tara:strand:- start:3210 stop:4658 length:1449 start_codon:yes stop_codon:yes gene_type:complete